MIASSGPKQGFNQLSIVGQAKIIIGAETENLFTRYKFNFSGPPGNNYPFRFIRTICMLPG